MRIQDLEEGFHEGPEELQTRKVSFIPVVVDIDEYMSLRRFLRRGSTMEVFNRVLDTLAIKTNNICRYRERGIGGARG